MKYINIQPVRSRTNSWIMFFIITIILMGMHFWQPPEHNLFITCYFKKMTGLPCPGCGITRSLCAMAKGDFVHSLKFHPLGLLIFIAIIVIWLKAIVELMFKRTLVLSINQKTKTIILYAFILLTGIFWMVRLGLTAGLFNTY